MPAVAQRAYFLLCQALGRLLRSVRYSKVRRGASEVRKRRSAFAPLLIAMSDPVVRLLDTGVRVLPQKKWHEREREIYARLYDTSPRIDADGTIVLPGLPGRTLAAVLEQPQLDEASRTKAIELSALALAAFHQRGFTHGDAMAENVLLDNRAAHWFDFETLHDASRPLVWRHADDVRALLMTCLVRTSPERFARTLHLILDAYANEDVTRVLGTAVTSVWRRALVFHLAQAPLSYSSFREVGRLLTERINTAK